MYRFEFSGKFILVYHVTTEGNTPVQCVEELLV
jgi:hypothetical protein